MIKEISVLKDVDMLGIDVDVQVCISEWRELLKLADDDDMESADYAYYEQLMVSKHGLALVLEAKKSL